jgi:hypothetical protein
MMQYSLLFYFTPENFALRDDPKGYETFWASFKSYVVALHEAGVVVGGAGLEAPSAAASLRKRDGKQLVQDGPYADTKEQLAGFFIIDVPDLDAAMEWAARYPALPGGGRE